jgi:hypothetical protein
MFGLYSNYLRRQINSQRANINKINEDINKYEQAQRDGSIAEDGFVGARDILIDINGSLPGILEGEAADAFSYLLQNYKRDCNDRARSMRNLIKVCQKRIADLEKQKKQAENTIAVLQSILNFTSKFNI